MKKEEGWKMYIEIQQYKKLGLNKSQIARKLDISWPTVDKYFDMSSDEFQKEIDHSNKRSKKPAIYEQVVLHWLRRFPDSSSAQVYDWLEEQHGALNFSEVTLRRFIRVLRQEHGIPKTASPRQYEAMEDPPMGKQIQVDFGEINVFTNTGRRVKLYVMCFVLSHSRYKYCEWQDRPFTTADIIAIHENAFEFFGGISGEIVYDQDHVILASENHGELLYAKAFNAYLKRRKFQIYMCRKSDPQTKGRIENVVGFIKKNFAHNRTFYNLERWNEDCIKWLQRRGNGKIHGTIKKIPAQVFQEERKYLRPILDKIKNKPVALSITYQVRKDNTVPIEGNRYSVPLGTYNGFNTYVRVQKENNEVIIYALETAEEIARHQIPMGKGNLVKNKNHGHKASGKIPTLMTELSLHFIDPLKAHDFFEKIREEKQRYIRDQLVLIQSVIKEIPSKAINEALEFCIKNRLHSAIDFRDAATHYSKEVNNASSETHVEINPIISELSEKIHMKPEIRDITEYTKLFHTNQT